jgi:tetratricopeptide (TPR) repeat protein
VAGRAGHLRVKPDEGQTAEAAGQVNGSPIRDRVLAALDGWLAFDPSPDVLAVLRATDPDPYRDEVRDALAAGDRPRALGLAGRPDALAQPPGFATALVHLGGLSMDRRVTVLESALRTRPGNLALLMALGNTYSQTPQERVAERVRWFQAAVAAHPGSAVAHNSLALALKDKGDRDGVLAEVREAVRLDPKYAHAHNNLGLTLRGKGDLDGALAEIREAIRLDPKLAFAHNNLGLVLEVKGDLNGALAAYHEALRHDPNWAGAHNNLAWLLAVGPDGVRDGKQAVAHATQACELTGWKKPGFLDTLAAAHAAAGDFDRAVEFEKKALSFPEYEKEDAKGGRRRLQLYAQKKPYRQSARAAPTVAPPRKVKP